MSFFCHLLTETRVWNNMRASRWWQNCHFWLNYSFNIQLYGEGLQSNEILLWMKLRKQTPSGQQNVLVIVTLSLCTWLGCNIVRKHCIVDTCLVLLVGFWGTFHWNVESPHHISQWTPFCDRNRNKKKHSMRQSELNSLVMTAVKTHWKLNRFLWPLLQLDIFGPVDI